MKWEKLGVLFAPSDILPAGYEYASVPIVEIINELLNLIRVYFTCRDGENRSEFRYVDIRVLHNTFEIQYLSDTIFSYGKIGAFDDAGVTVCSIVDVEKKKYAYYQGWSLGVSVPSITAIGIVELKNNSFLRFGDGPIMSRTLLEPYSCASPTVIFHKGIFKMWYVAMDKWIYENEKIKHYYDIRYAESKDGFCWNRKGERCITYENNKEYAFGRPFVKIEDRIYKMWYCYRGEYYKIGYAESIDGIIWVRKDNEMDFDISHFGWDSEMIEYPCIFDINNVRYLLYNGNGYGKSGIGIAKLK
jgi:hypothetical protein